jgi:tetratricopeptide (TPR) repeat protein
MARLFVLFAFALMLGGCATPPPRAALPAGLFDDSLFADATLRVDAAEVMALSPAMRRYIDDEVRLLGRQKNLQQALVELLYARGKLRLEYDAAMTRNAREAFEARAGNCLSLVIMTAAMAQHLGLTVSFQSVPINDAWERSGNLHLLVGHVNLVLGPRFTTSAGWGAGERLLIDFMPNPRSGHALPIDTERVLAMYMNNKAAESLAAHNIADAYAWARAAVQQDVNYTASLNTLGVIYQRRGAMEQAERALRHVLKLEPRNVPAMGNLVLALQRQGREAESQALAAELRRLQPVAPFEDFKAGMKAMEERDFRSARQHFERELARSPDYHESHFWLAQTLAHLGEHGKARKHLELALDNSPTREQTAIYAGKLQRLKAQTTGRPEVLGPRL